MSVAENLVKSIGGNICCVLTRCNFPNFLSKLTDCILPFLMVFAALAADEVVALKVR